MNYGLKSHTVETQQKLLELAVLNAQQDLLIKQQKSLTLQIEVLENELKERGAL